MRAYLSVDIEGIAGIAHWDEARPSHDDHKEFRDRMTAHTSAACEGAHAGGAETVLVKDAHEHGRNLLAEKLPRYVQLIRGWSGHPFCMVQELDDSFDALLLLGYHAAAGSGATPLAHTMSSATVTYATLNGTPFSEFLMHGYAASLCGVPVAFVSGDAQLCEHVAALSAQTVTVPVMHGVGDSVVTMHPLEAEERIREGAQRAMSQARSIPPLAIPSRLELVIRFNKSAQAYKASFYPGVASLDAHTVVLTTDDYFEVLRALAFLV